MYQLDYLDMLSGEDVERVADNAYGIFEYLDEHRLDEEIDFGEPTESLAYHGHCQKATRKDHYAVGVLRRAGYEVDPLDSGCYGMAVSFGYETEHLSMSRAIGDILFDQVEESWGDQVIAPGASCRSQLAEHDEQGGDQPPHPIGKTAAAVREV